MTNQTPEASRQPVVFGQADSGVTAMELEHDIKRWSIPHISHSMGLARRIENDTRWSDTFAQSLYGALQDHDGYVIGIHMWGVAGTGLQRANVRVQAPQILGLTV
jgi:hypothetical protein